MRVSIPQRRRLNYFNPRTHKECDKKDFQLPARVNYFNPRTHKECDACFHTSKATAQLFQSTHSQGVRPPRIPALISGFFISIHALTRSATTKIKLIRSRVEYFNPRTHKECDHLYLLLTQCQKVFQSTHSQGVRLKGTKAHAEFQKFQSTHSQGVRHNPRTIDESNQKFQSTHSQGVRL
ncbi:MAG: hypothetical protein ACFWTI_10300 [Lactobacillus helveticus]